VDESLQRVVPVLTASTSDASALKAACDAYEVEMIARGAAAVLSSRQACLDAHNYGAISEQSPLVSKRVAEQQNLTDNFIYNRTNGVQRRLDSVRPASAVLVTILQVNRGPGKGNFANPASSFIQEMVWF
jgi:hypothetical protein